MRMPRFFAVVHQVVSTGCWQRLLAFSFCEHEFGLISSSTPSVTTNSTSCGVLPAVPAPGSGMALLTVDIAVSKFVSVSLLLLEQVSQLFLQTSMTSMALAAVCAVLRFEVSDWTVLIESAKV